MAALTNMKSNADSKVYDILTMGVQELAAILSAAIVVVVVVLVLVVSVVRVVFAVVFNIIVVAVIMVVDYGLTVLLAEEINISWVQCC